MKKQQEFNVKGITRDISVSKSDGKYAFDIKNMRITAQEGDTLLSLVNEKGNKEYNIIFPEDTVFKGDIIGYCALNTYIVIFTHNANCDCIYRLELASDKNTLNGVCLYEGNLEFSNVKPEVFETLGVYESETIQKVYWIDGVHQPRFINITANEDVQKSWKSQLAPFDFVPAFDNDEEVTIQRNNNSGSFPVGTVQYAMSYYNLNGQQTNIFYVSPLYYTSHLNRGASADESSVGNSFLIIAKNLSKNFEYLRIYRIVRTSMEGIPLCNIVQDIFIGDNSTINIVDTGSYGTSIDPTELLYIGGRAIVPQAMTQKNNTLFLGNYSITTPMVPEYLSKEITNNAKDNFSYTYKNAIEKGTIGNLYMYKNQLDSNSQEITTFKGGETYRFGVVFQDTRGEWSNIVYLGDFSNDKYPEDNIDSFKPVQGMFTLSKELVTKLYNEGYRKVKGVVVYPNNTDREVICQGVLSPTVYSIYNRRNNSPYAQSSWFFRDIHGGDHVKNSVQNKHNYNISTFHGNAEKQEVYVIDSSNWMWSAVGEQCYGESITDGEICTTDSEIYGASREDISVYDEGSDSNKMDMFVDWNVLTLNSPDIDFTESILETEGLKLRIVGVIPLTSNASDINITTTTAPSNTDITNFLRNNVESSNISFAGNNIRSSDFDWKDYNYRYTDSVTKTAVVEYPIFPWQRSTSLVSQAKTSNTETWVSALNTKIISNIRTSALSVFCDKENTLNYDISNIGIYNGVNALSRLSQDPNDQDYLKNMNYYGEVDTLLVPQGTGYYLYKKHNDNLLYTRNTSKGMSKDSVRIKYKSSPHAAFQLRYSSDHRQTILPSLTIISNGVSYNRGSQTSPKKYPIWSDKNNGSNSSHTDIIYNAINIPVVITKDSDGNTIDNDWVKNHTDVLNIDGIGQSYSTDTDKEQFPSGCYIAKLLLSNYVNNFNTAIGRLILFPNVNFWNNSDVQELSLNTETIKDTDWDKQPMLYIISQVVSDEGNKFELIPLIADDMVEYSLYYYYIDKENSITKYYELKSTYTKDGKSYSNRYPSLIKLFESTTSSTDILTENYIKQDVFQIQTPLQLQNFGFLYLGELYRDNVDKESRFGGTTTSALIGNTWNTAGKAVALKDTESIEIPFTQGDTYYQRYDCLKTYASSNLDNNQIVEILSFMCETRINIDGRCDTNRGRSSNLNMSKTNFNLLNTAYTQKDNLFGVSYLDYRRDTNSHFPNTLVWSKTKTFGEDIDAWLNIQQANSLDLDGSKGELTALTTYNDILLAFQDNGVSRILYDERVQINASDGVPIEIANSNKVTGRQYMSDHIGCSNKKTICPTAKCLYFMDSNSKDIFALKEGISSLSKAKGFNSYLYNKDFSKYRTFFDKKASDVYFVDDNSCLVYSEQFDEFEGFYSYENTDYMFNFQDAFIAIKNNTLWQQFAGDYNCIYNEYHPFSVTVISNQDDRDKIFTNVEFLADSWDSKENLTENTFDTLSVWNEYQYGVENLKNLSFPTNYMFSNIRKKFRTWRVNIPRASYLSPIVPLDKVANIVEFQESNQVLPSGYISEKSNDRIRNPWVYLKLSMQQENYNKTILHNILVDYHI